MFPDSPDLARFKRRLSRVASALDRGAERAAAAARRLSNREPKEDSGDHAFVFNVMASIAATSMLAAVVLVALAPR